MKLVSGLCALALAGVPGWGQEFRGTLTGRVTDSQQAVVPGVKVLAVQVETGARYETLTAADGQFTLPFLAPGSYHVSAEVTGFKRYLREGVVVGANQRVALDIALELGQLAESVTVTADAPLLQTATASSGQVIDSREIETLPLNGRTPIVLAHSAFGVLARGETWLVRPFDNSRVSSISMGGAPLGANELLVDGAPNTQGKGDVAYSPPMESVAEVKVEIFQPDAAYGHTGGGTMNVVLKAGTNALRGSVYEFNQVSRLAASPFFTNSAGLRKQVTRYNQWGVTSSGPVVLPGVFNGRSRLFFYFAYEGLKNPAPDPSTTAVPTAPQRTGDFSQLLALGSKYTIYDPLSGRAEGSRIRRQPVPGNVIAPQRIDSIARKYLDFYPLPNQPGQPDGQDNYLANMVRDDSYHNELGRIDANLGVRHKLFFSFRHNDHLKLAGNRFGNIATGNLRPRTNWGAMLDQVTTLSPTLVLNTRLNWTRFVEAQSRPSNGIDLTTLGFPSALQAISPRTVLPKVTLGSYQSLGDSGGYLTPYDSFQVFSSATKVRASHTLKLGLDLRLYRESSVDYGNSAGNYKFGNNWTRGPLDNSAAAPMGQELASFLLGLPTAGSFDLTAARTNQAGYYSLFLQDDIRLRPGLTVNLGLRYEKGLPTRERFDRSVNGFDFTTPSPIDAAVRAAYDRRPIPEIPAGQFRALGGLLFAGPGHHDVYHTPSHDFSPRFGFAWKPSGLGNRTVVRGGVALFYFGLGTTGVNQIGFSQSTQLVATLDGYLTPSASLSNPFPTGIQQPTGSRLGLATYLGQGVAFFNPHILDPYSVRWSFNLQRELRPNLLLELGYQGNHAVHLNTSRQWNFTPAQYLSSSPLRDQAVIDRLTANVPNPFAGLIPGTALNGSTVSHSQLLQAHPQFTGVGEDYLPEGSSYYHALVLRISKRISRGLQFQMNSHYSRMMERRTRLNDSDTLLEKRVAAEDRPFRLVMTANYELPFGPHKPFASGAHPLLASLIGGWTVGGIFTLQPGPPLTWGNVIYYGGGLGPDPRRRSGAFDVTRFNREPGQQLGQNIRAFPSQFSNLRADGVSNFDLSAIKNIKLRETVSLQYRCEFFNALNHPLFDAPNLKPTDSNFGRITNQSNLPRSIQMALRLVW